MGLLILLFARNYSSNASQSCRFKDLALKS